MKLIVKYFQSWFDFDTKPNSSEDFPTQESKALVSALVINSYGKFAGHQNPRLSPSNSPSVVLICACMVLVLVW